MRIKSKDTDFIEAFEVNNFEYELQEYTLSNGKKSYALVWNDFLKHPDKLEILLKSFPHFNNPRNHSARPGKGFLFHPEWYENDATFSLMKALFDAFKINVEITGLYTNCFPGVTEEDEGVFVFPPHADVHVGQLGIDFGGSNDLVTNLGLTKGSFENGTSFWSFNGKKSVFEMNKHELNEYSFHNSELKRNDLYLKSWNNTEENCQWKFEYFVPMKYNSLVCYSPGWFHQPYYNKNDFVNFDRFSLATFYKIRMYQVHEIPEEIIPDAYDIWEKFDITTKYDHYF